MFDHILYVTSVVIMIYIYIYLHGHCLFYNGIATHTCNDIDTALIQ